MKRVLFFLILVITNNIYSQKNLFDTLTIDSSTKIIGRYPHYDKTKTYEKYNFIIEDSIKIADFVQMIKLGEEVPNSLERPSFKIDVIKNYKEKGGWTINPTLKSAMTHDGHTYKFNLEQIANLNEDYPFEYYYEKVIFKSLKEYKSYLEEQKSKPNFLFDYAPQFKYEGSFEIEFKKSNKFSSPKAISEYLEPLIEEIVNEDEYRVSYIANEKNIKNRNISYTMTITGPKKIFNKLKIRKFKNENWKPTIEDGWFFYQK